tara:strand:+ start:258 stop:743 length:486 start_codon:yes stop_codon:yes gene_type:complete
MNLIKLIKNKLSNPFHKKVSTLLNNMYSSKNKNIVHNNGKLVRDGKHIVKIEHDLLPGIYLRRMILARSAYIVSAIHKRDHVWFLLAGHITVATSKSKKDYVAPYMGFSKAGTQRVIYAHEDSIFQNVFQNPFEYKNLDKLEEHNYSLTKEDYDNFIRNSK